MRVIAAALVYISLTAVVLGTALLQPSHDAAPTANGAFPLHSYYFEAHVTSPDGPPDQPYTIIRGWYQAPDKTRWEVSCSGDPSCSQLGSRVLLVAGGEVWLFDPATGDFQHDVVGGTPTGRPYAFLSNFQPGPLAPGLFDDRLGPTVVKKQESILGIPVTNYADSLWVDEAHSFVLRQRGQTDTPYLVEVTRVQYNPRLDSAIFRFTPPANAVAASPTATAIPQTPTPIPDATVISGADSLQPTYLPSGYQDRGGSYTTLAGVTTDETRYTGFGNVGSLTIRQERGTRAPSDATAAARIQQACGTAPATFAGSGFCDTPVAPSGTPGTVGGYRVFTSSAGTSLVFQRGDVSVTISSPNLAPDELVRVAQGLK